MLYLRSCPKCKGDMHADSDIYGTYRQCLQCGYLEDITEKAEKLGRPQADYFRRRSGRKVA